jgi:carbon monoxide dehydrogenase subunit G
MRHEFSLPQPALQVLSACTRLDLLAHGMPELLVADAQPDQVEGRLKVRFGSTSITYRGTATLHQVSADPPELRVDVRGGQARASATSGVELTIRLTEDGDEKTTVTVTAQASLGGRAAELPPKVVRAAGRRLLDRFAASVADVVATLPPEDTRPAARVEGGGSTDARAENEPSEPTGDDGPSSAPPLSVAGSVAGSAAGSVPGSEPDLDDDPLGLLAPPERSAPRALAALLAVFVLLLAFRYGRRRADRVS